MGRLRHSLSEREKAILEGSVHQIEEFDGPHRFLRRGDIYDRSMLLIEGVAVRTIYDKDQRYIVGVQVPGDFVDLHAFALKRLDHDILGIGAVKVGYVLHERLRELMQSEPHLSRAFWFSTLLDAAIHRQWTLKMGQLKANRRVAHLFCELWTRLDMVGLARTNGFKVPLTQADLADMCGTTAIHMNRALGELRRAGIAEFRRGRVIVDDREALERHADFDSDYLYGEGSLHIGDALEPA